MDALRDMHVCGNMLSYVEAFLSDRSFRVRVAVRPASLEL